MSATRSRPGRVATRAISAITARGSGKWWNAKRDTTTEKLRSGNGSGSTLPMCQSTLLRESAAACSRAFSIIAGVRSMPVAWRQTFAKAATTSPGPQATSSTVSAALAPENSTSSRSASSSRIAAELANGVAWRVN
jgi:hypothetical protein